MVVKTALVIEADQEDARSATEIAKTGTEQPMSKPVTSDALTEQPMSAGGGARVSSEVAMELTLAKGLGCSAALSAWGLVTTLIRGRCVPSIELSLNLDLRRTRVLSGSGGVISPEM